jgi:hypothetical protein
LKDGRLKCIYCKFRFTSKSPSFKIDRRTLKSIIQEFILEHSTDTILSRVNVSKYKLLKTLTLLRIAMTKDVPDVFEGTVEVDETYIGGHESQSFGKIKHGVTADCGHYAVRQIKKLCRAVDKIETKCDQSVNRSGDNTV